MAKIKRGLFRLWVVASVGWVAYCGWYVLSHWRPREDLSYLYPEGKISFTQYAAEHGLVIFGIPAGAFLLGAALLWATQGFTGTKPDSDQQSTGSVG